MCAASLGLASAANAQDTIVVEGERIETADIRNTARDITFGARAMFQPLARFNRPVCPGVYGLGEANAQAVVDRIVSNALAAGIDVSEEPGCGANAWVVIVDDAGATFDQLVEDDSFMTRHLTRFQRRMVREQSGSARAWNQITRRNPDTGAVLASGWESTVARLEAAAGGVPAPINEVSTISRLDLGIRMDIELSVVLIERSAIGELDVAALADYATMRLLARTETPDRDNPVRTVMTMFDPERGVSAPQRMTPFDFGYLTALYRSSPTRPARMAMGGIQYHMERIGETQSAQ
ncbi:hypothetical protein [Aurantiacibacter sediminis]|uniref:DUF2927 domain-containing protein n=2 Tax=Aurantiacibacter sediminis TaxID=2793064 RepID=A0ABS0N1T6_9SPHN|nr:hypothetical protein [Aurantiacibacter sediminis]